MQRIHATGSWRWRKERETRYVGARHVTEVKRTENNRKEDTSTKQKGNAGGHTRIKRKKKHWETELARKLQ